MLASVSVLIAAACGGGPSPGSVSESVEDLTSFTGKAVPASGAIYISGIYSVGQTSLWLGESWFTRGHSHTGLFKSEANGSGWQQMLGWDGWPLWQKYFDSQNALVAAEFEEGCRLHLRLLRTADGGLHWRAADMPVGPFSGWSAQSIDFTDPNNSWLMIGLGSFGDVACGKRKKLSQSIGRATVGPRGQKSSASINNIRARTDSNSRRARLVFLSERLKAVTSRPVTRPKATSSTSRKMVVTRGTHKRFQSIKEEGLR